VLARSFASHHTEIPLRRALILRVAILWPRIGRLRFGREFWIEHLAGGFGAYYR